MQETPPKATISLKLIRVEIEEAGRGLDGNTHLARQTVQDGIKVGSAIPSEVQ